MSYIATEISATYLSVQRMIALRFPYMSWTNKSLVLSLGLLCACWGMLAKFPQVAYSYALAYTSCLCRPSRSARIESLGSSQLFLRHRHSSRYAHSPVCGACGLLDSQEYIETFESTLWIARVQCFLLRFFFIAFC